MKLNGSKNIILDSDITITDPKNFGDSLSDVLHKQQSDINDLKSNVKWIYKYGGVGSGSGGGGTSTKWSIVATLDNKAIQNRNTISLDSETTSYVLDIRISGGTGSFYVEYSYGNVSRTLTLSADNGWREKVTINLTSNGHIAISASDGLIIKSVESDYITTPYIFSDIKYYKSDLESTWTSNAGDIFMETAAVEGLWLGCDYTFAIKAQVSYKWEFLNTITEGTIENSTGKLYIQVPNELLENGGNAGLYSAKLTICVTPEGQTEIVIVKTINFNLIPAHLYLKISPSNGGELIYDEVQDSDYYKYSVNKNIGFNCKAYKGTNDNMPCTITFTTESLAPGSSERISGQTNGFESQNYLITMKFATEGWHKIVFTCSMDNETKTYIKYLYCFKVSSEYSWYKLVNGALASSKGTIKKSTYYRISKNDITEGFGLQSNLDMGVNQDERIINTDPNLVDGCTEFVINLGIQYDKINNINIPIVGFNTKSGEDNILVYQNKVVLSAPYFITGSEEREIFIPKLNNFDPGNSLNYHLLTIAYTKANYNKETGDTRYQCCLYIDGILVGAFKTFGTGSQPIYSTKFYKGNYSINLLDISYFESDTCAINDVDINYYHTTYVSTKDNVEVDYNITSILNNFYDVNIGGGSTYSLENNLLKVQGTLSDNIGELVDVPTLVFRRDRILSEYGNMSVIDWMNGIYGQDTQGDAASYKVPVEVRWGKGLKTTSPITIDDSYGSARFYIKLQGSSTMGNKSKNFTFGIETEQDSAYQVLFSPNYVSDNNKTFLPEQSFTLKADVVDSSHSNNTAMGAFINDNNNFEYEYNSVQSNVEPEIMGHVRQCLEGFPVLVYLELTDSTKVYEDEFYYLGVYNFNLGRDSYFNLGYCDLSQLNGLGNVGDGFVFTTVESINPLNNFTAAEIQGNRKYWDFSQFDQSILFQIDNNDNSGEYMFGDIVKNSNDTVYTRRIQDFVQNVAYGGGYMFNAIGKNFEDINLTDDDSICYHTVGTVPDVAIQYKRGGSEYATYTKSGYDVPTDIFTRQSYLDTCINPVIDGEKNTPFLNYDSAVHYYTTCMVFGLVDSVQKNLNIKTWNGKTFGLFFYDMDTSLGTSNSGGDTSYFCFSDYWDNKVTEIFDEETGELKETILNGVTINRDYYPLSHGGVIGYDTPSSYLFAICKYVPILSEYKDWLSPQTLYARWRQKGGVLENAEKFINNYYAKNLSNIPDCLLNLNYRNKFLYGLTGDSFRTEYEGLKGTKIEKTKDWLNGRLHILDAYFNLPKTSIRINETNEQIVYTEPIPQVNNLSDNKDIYVLKDIFLEDVEGGSSKWLTREGKCSFKVTADAYSPLLVSKAGKISRYLLVDPNTKYTINENFTGQESANFGGSDLWTSLESVNSFIDTLALKTGFYMNSEKISSIEGNSNSILNGEWKFITPASETIKLNGPNYEGRLAIDDSFTNLTTLDLSKSKISLTVNGSKLKTLNVKNINSSEVTLNNCNHLQEVNLENATIGTLDIRPAWDANATFNGNKFVKLYIKGKDVNGTYGTLTVTSAPSLTDIDFGQFSNIVISGCTKLSRITCSDEDASYLKSVKITNCSSLKSLTIWGEELTTLDLSGCGNLEYIVLRGKTFDKLKVLNLQNTKVKYIEFVDLDTSPNKSVLDLRRFTNLCTSTSNSSYFKIGNNPNVVTIRVRNERNNPFYIHYNLQGCPSLERIYGHIRLNCTGCFQNDGKFSINGSDLTNASWKGKLIVKNKIIQTPDLIIEKSVENITTDDMFWDSDNATNISLNSTNASSNFYGTNCSVFDYYYFFWTNPNVQECPHTFYVNKNEQWGRFKWAADADNSPSWKLFIRNKNITNLTSCFYVSTTTSPIRLFSPTVSGSTVVKDDGLFSNLTKLTNISWIFNGYTCYADRFLFRRTSGNYALQNMTGFNIKLIVDDVKSFNVNESFNVSKLNQFGNLNGFFENLQNVKIINGFLNATEYINYDSMNNGQLVLPKNVIALGKCFISNYATGEIKIKDYCQNSIGIIEDIVGSFRVTATPLNDDLIATFRLNNDTFAGFKSIKRIGFGTNPGGDGNFSTSFYTESSFNGSGLKKLIDSEEFPFDIITNTQSKDITSLNGIFWNAVPEKSEYQNLMLPGNMFVSCSKLQNISAMFMNIQNDYKLSDDAYSNFKNCSKLEDVSYLFANEDYNSNPKKDPRLSGSIPLRFFYHGGVIKNVEEKTVADNVEFTYDELGNQIATPTDSWIIESVQYEQPFITINNMKYCFMHSNLSYYVNENINDCLEYNPNYAPYNWIYNSKVNSWSKNVNRDENYYTDIWAYDGQHWPSENEKRIEHLDDLSKDTDFDYTYIADSNMNSYPQIGEASGYYIAPPDLLRYCTTSANIEGLFSHSGVQGWSGTWNGVNGSKYKYGIIGRICPYMLKPVSDTTSIKNMFNCCKRLSYYKTSESGWYLIPKDFFKYATRITSLESAFADMVFPKLININVFKPLTGTLNVKELFYQSYWDGTSSNKVLIENIFDDKRVSSTTRAFCIVDHAEGSEDRVRSQYIRFNNVFNNIYASASYNGNENYMSTFRGYSASTVEHENPKTLSNSDLNKNYETV